MSAWYDILLVIHVLLTMGLIGVILLQRPASDGLGGLAGGGGGQFMTGRAQANLLTRGTAVMATLFIISSLTLAYVTQNSAGDGIAERIEVLEPEIPVSAPLGDDDPVPPAIDGEPAQQMPAEPQDVPIAQ
jgi:preprotein translocase subunit SecG